MEAVDGVSYVRLNIDDSRPELQISIDRQKAAAMQISARTILQAIETGIAGTIASKYREGRHEYDIRVRLRPEDRRELADLERIFVATPSGRQGAAAQPDRGTGRQGAGGHRTRNQERAVTIQAGMTGTRDFGSLATEIEELLAATAVPQGFQVRMGGEREEQQEANRNVHLIVVLSILLVYMIMAALFESLLHPFVILLAIPFAAIGGILSLWLTGTNVSMPVWIGGIMLVGVAVNNGIIMVDYINQLRQRGFDVMEATWRGAVTRLRPVLITTLTTALALLPLASGYGEGGEIWAPPRPRRLSAACPSPRCSPCFSSPPSTASSKNLVPGASLQRPRLTPSRPKAPCSAVKSVTQR